MNEIIGMGIANQRETTILWDVKTGVPVHPAIVWEDKRTASYCNSMQKKFGGTIQKKTGLTADPYFSASKIRWVLQNVPVASRLLRERRLRFGTVDSWVAWNFLEHCPHVTDATNASRTLLFNTRSLSWDKELMRIFGIPKEILPEVRKTESYFGNIKKDIVGVSIPLYVLCGDQQASLFAAGTKPGTTKVTYGTGIFINQVLGKRFRLQRGFFTALAPLITRPLYALEAKIEGSAKRVSRILKDQRALVKAVEVFAQQAANVVNALPKKPKEIVIDGGISQNKDLPAFQARATGVRVRKQKDYDGTALGVAMLVMDAMRRGYKPAAKR